MAEGHRGAKDEHERDTRRVAWYEEIHGHPGALDAQVRGVAGGRRHRHFVADSFGPARGQLLEDSDGHLEDTTSCHVVSIRLPCIDLGVYSRESDKGNKEARHDPTVVNVSAPQS